MSITVVGRLVVDEPLMTLLFPVLTVFNPLLPKLLMDTGSGFLLGLALHLLVGAAGIW